jgi:hypothetical protein
MLPASTLLGRAHTSGTWRSHTCPTNHCSGRRLATPSAANDCPEERPTSSTVGRAAPRGVGCAKSPFSGETWKSNWSLGDSAQRRRLTTYTSAVTPPGSWSGRRIISSPDGRSCRLGGRSAWLKRPSRGRRRPARWKCSTLRRRAGSEKVSATRALTFNWDACGRSHALGVESERRRAMPRRRVIERGRRVGGIGRASLARVPRRILRVKTRGRAWGCKRCPRFAPVRGFRLISSQGSTIQLVIRCRIRWRILGIASSRAPYQCVATLDRVKASTTREDRQHQVPKLRWSEMSETGAERVS